MFVDKVLGEGANVTETGSMLCHSYWKRTPLDTAEVDKFVREMPPDDVAILISAKSGTPLEVRRKSLLMHYKNLADTPAAGGWLRPENTPRPPGGIGGPWPAARSRSAPGHWPAFARNTPPYKLRGCLTLEGKSKPTLQFACLGGRSEDWVREYNRRFR